MKFYKLRELCDDIIDCPHSTPDWKECGYRIIRNFNLKNGSLDFSDGYFVDESTYIERTKRAIPEEGDIVISREAPMGVVAIIPKGLKCCLGQRLVLLKVNKEKCNPIYLLNVLMSDFVQIQFRRADATGSIVSNLCIPDLKEIVIPIIENGQDEVAHLLDVISRKQAVNNAICDNLQQMVKAVFDFHFARRTPNGKLFQIVDEHEKSTVQVGDSEGVAGKYPFFTSGETVNEWQTSMVDGINCFLATGGYATIKVYSGEAAYSTDTWCISGKGDYSAYLYFYLKSIINSINTSYFAGSGLKHLQKEGLLLIDLYLPSHDELEAFNKVAIPAIKRSSELFRETKLLEKQRNFLLPMLMNGQATIAE